MWRCPSTKSFSMNQFDLRGWFLFHVMTSWPRFWDQMPMLNCSNIGKEPIKVSALGWNRWTLPLDANIRKARTKSTLERVTIANWGVIRVHACVHANAPLLPPKHFWPHSTLRWLMQIVSMHVCNTVKWRWAGCQNTCKSMRRTLYLIENRIQFSFHNFSLLALSWKKPSKHSFRVLARQDRTQFACFPFSKM